MSKLTIFYDATCPLCAKEMASLKRYDRHGHLHMVDIHSEEFANYPQIDAQEANDILHALDENGKLYLGLDAAYQAWKAVGKGCLYAPLRWKLVKPFADRAYLRFAKNRYRISFWLTGQSRCESGTCSH